ncbi:MAG TPA: hypothetical protein VFV92_04700 [Candidatus Bathyarchaeia archaeon]|nr:hypothetical protein [Candidatus Bathyarchaeia archaeon]
MTIDKPLAHRWGHVSLFQLLVGITLIVAGAAAMLRLSEIWSVTEVRYAEYSLILLWGAMLIIGALRRS